MYGGDLTINRQQKQKIYNEKYKNIPIDFDERLSYMIDYYHLSEKKMDEILLKRDIVINNLFYYDYKVIELYEEPEGASRPRARLTKNNYNKMALNYPDLIHIYVPNAMDDRNYMRKLTETELYDIDGLIYTPCEVEYNVFMKTPSNANITDIFLCEIGLFRPPFKKPDWDNIAKKYCDMYNANIWMDDALVIDGSVHKYYSILPRIEIKLRYLNCLYTKRDFDMLINRKEFDGSRPVQYLNSKGDIVNGLCNNNTKQ